MMKERLVRVVRNRHGHPLARFLAGAAKAYLRGYNNELYYRFAANGEAFALRSFARVHGDRPCVVFDVGAHYGDWTRCALGILPRTEVHCFEVAPETVPRLLDHLRDEPRVTVNPFGLSAAAGTLPLTYVPEADSTTTLHEPVIATQRGFTRRTCAAEVRTGDAYLAERGMASIGFLKIDTEGHELDVLKGFAETLARAPIPMIQFEHGEMHIAARSLMRDFHRFLEPLGYRLGKLHPRCVAFRSYDPFEDEHFRTRNYVAVHEDEQTLLEVLSG